MEKRRSERMPVCLSAGLTAGRFRGSCIIENACEHGMHVIAASKKSTASFVPEKIVRLNIQDGSGKEAVLHCEVRWVHINKTPIHGFTYRMGMEVIENAPVYRDFLGSVLK